MNNGSIYLLLVLGASLVFPAMAQHSYDITSTQPAQVNGIEYGYTIRTESKREVSNLGTFKRYELTVYVTNKSGAVKLFSPRHATIGVRDQDLLARFDCVNATGAKLTSKTITVRARPIATASTKNTDDKVTASTVQAGHMLENGETITNNIIVIVPDGEQPQIRVRIKEPETQYLR